MVLYDFCNPNTEEAEEERLCTEGQPGHIPSLSLQTNNEQQTLEDFKSS